MRSSVFLLFPVALLQLILRPFRVLCACSLACWPWYWRTSDSLSLCLWCVDMARIRMGSNRLHHLNELRTTEQDVGSESRDYREIVQSEREREKGGGAGQTHFSIWFAPESREAQQNK